MATSRATQQNDHSSAQAAKHNGKSQGNISRANPNTSGMVGGQQFLQRYVGNQKLGMATQGNGASAGESQAAEPVLQLGPVFDKYEAEASAVADSVMQESGSGAHHAAGGDAATVRRMPVQPMGATTGTPISPTISQEIQSAKSNTTLDSGIRRMMESRLGADLGKVRLHTGTQADMLNRKLDARAFTKGNDIFFRSGEYNPQSNSGKHLLAHELTHVAQQGSGTVQREMIQRVPTVSTAGGDWKANVYAPVQDGAEIEIEFVPNKGVNAKKIGLIQSSLKVEKGINYDTSARQKYENNEFLMPAQKRKAQRSDGTRHIDRHISANNPIYGAANLGQDRTIADTAMGKLDHSAKAQRNGTMVNYQLGYRYKWGPFNRKRSAKLYDMPQLPGATHAMDGEGKKSEMTFETTAVALTGAQAGQYYGSVQWGWKIDKKDGGVELTDFAVKSAGTASPEMKKTMENWNQGEFSDGVANPQIPLPADDVED